MKYDLAIARGMIEGALIAGLLLALLSSCATPGSDGYAHKVYAASTCSGQDIYSECVASLASAQCRNGMNDYDARRDRRRRLHVYAGCD